MADALEITVNGQRHRVTAAADTPLLYVLRNELGLNSPRFGCGLATVRSCVTPVSTVRGPVTTLEGLGTREHPHPLQQAFIAEQAAQCGYCINGMIMTAAALLKQSPRPSESEVRSALDGNLCRCGTHMRILRAIRRVARA